MTDEFLDKSPLSKKEMENCIDTLGLNATDKEIVILSEGLFGKKRCRLLNVCRKFEITIHAGKRLKNRVYKKMRIIRIQLDRDKLRNEILECVRTGKPIFKWDKKRKSYSTNSRGIL